jgi:hypothetical protein
MSYPRPIELYHLHANLIWWDGPFKNFEGPLKIQGCFYLFVKRSSIKMSPPTLIQPYNFYTDLNWWDGPYKLVENISAAS